jgi:predicted DNA-binding transcriptional regulator AlpA
MAVARTHKAPVTEPAALRREHAAKHCAISAGHFDKMVREGFLPPPRDLCGMRVWLRGELDDALFALPYIGGEIGGNTCDTLFTPSS